MRKVVDSNFLQSDELRVYLSKSVKNHAVLSDYAAMEAYKGDTLASIYRSMAILANYPKQVIVLKGTQAVCGLSTRSPGLQKRLIDKHQTREFGAYCNRLFAAKRGNRTVQRQLLDLGRKANSHMERMLRDAGTLSSAFDEIASIFSNSELHRIRTGADYSEEMVDKAVKSILELAAHMFADHPRIRHWPEAEELTNSFIFRSALCGYLLSLDWIAEGGASGARLERLRNDMVDINFAAYATYFDGILSADRKLTRIYQQAAVGLKTIFALNRFRLGGQ